MSGMTPVALRQVHGAVVRIVENVPKETLEGDGLLTQRPGLALFVATADCLPVLLAHREGRFVGAVHAGWRGTAKRIAQRAVEKACREFGSKPEEICAALGPRIGPCCFEVRADVFNAFQEAGLGMEVFREAGHETWRLDLAAANAAQLAVAGLPAENIEVLDYCTFCHEDLFWSHRRDVTKGGAKKTGRMWSSVGVRISTNQVKVFD
jgi:hypothetical protein